jgi:hypothetical protein
MIDSEFETIYMAFLLNYGGVTVKLDEPAEGGWWKILEPICGLFGASAHRQINKLLSVEGTEMLYQFAVSCKAL